MGDLRFEQPETCRSLRPREFPDDDKMRTAPAPQKTAVASHRADGERSFSH